VFSSLKTHFERLQYGTTEGLDEINTARVWGPFIVLSRSISENDSHNVKILIGSFRWLRAWPKHDHQCGLPSHLPIVGAIGRGLPK
jgi:hypothetical protein